MSIKERIQFWDNQAPRWVNHEPFGDLRDDINRLVRQTVQPYIANLPDAGTVLELGAGANSHGYFDNRPDLKVISVDLSHAMLRHNHSKWKVQSDVCRALPIASGAVDLCTSFFLMRYLSEEEHGSLLREIERVLKPNTLFLIIDLLENRWEQQLSIFNPTRMVKTARELGYRNVFGQIQERTYSKYISTGFGGWDRTARYSYGVLSGQKR